MTTHALRRLVVAGVILATTSAYNQTFHQHHHQQQQQTPRKTIEVYEVELPRHIVNTSLTQSRNLATDPNSRYEILIQPNRNRKDVAGTQKIKIFVEAEDEPEGNRRSDNYQPLPLTISTYGLNVDTLQQIKPGSGGDGSPNKRQVHVTQAPRRDHVALSARIPTSQKSSNTYVQVAKAKEIATEVYTKTVQAPVQESGGYSRVVVPSSNQGNQYRVVTTTTTTTVPPTTKTLVYEPGRGITATSQVRRPSSDLEYGETRRPEEVYVESQYDTVLRPSASDYDNVRRPATSEYDSNRRPMQPEYNNSRRPATSEYESGRKPMGSEYDNDRRPATSDYDSARRPSVPEYDEDRRPSDYDSGRRRQPSSEYDSRRPSDYDSGRRPSEYDRERRPASDYDGGQPNRKTSYDDQSYDDGYGDTRDTSHQGNRAGTSRPVRQDGYLGFPESYTSNMYTSARPFAPDDSSRQLVSPCPDVFRYTAIRDDRWYANVYVSTSEELVGMRLDIILDRPADLLAAESAEVKSRDNTRFTVLSLKKRLIPGTVETVEIMAKHNSVASIPKAKTVILNGRQICPPRSYTKATTRPTYVFPGDVPERRPHTTTERSTTDPYNRPVVTDYNHGTSTYKRTTPKPSSNPKRTTQSVTTEYVAVANPDVYDGDFAFGGGRPATKKPNPHRPSHANSKPPGQVNKQPGLIGNDNRRPIIDVPVNNGRPSSSSSSGDRDKREVPCGLPVVQPRPLITNGQMTTRGQWPWHAALYRNMGLNLSYSCGGTLISHYHVVTAAHCVTAEYSSRPLDPKVFLVYFGKYHLYVWTENGIANREVSRVTVHPSYNATSFRSDIAILTLSSRIEYTDFIRPVCMWDKRSTRIDDLVGLEGTVVGWGSDETKQLTEELKQAKMPIARDSDCLRSYPEFYSKFTSNMTYCAGFKNGTSVCNGDSGGGMVFPIKVDRQEKWFLRGLVSLSPSEKNSRICDVSHYAVFTDIAKYLPWVEEVMARDE